MDNRKQDIAYFISFYIEQYKNAKGISGAEAVALLSEYGVLEYLSEHWEVLHTQSRQWLVEDIDDYIRLRDKDCKLVSVNNHFENPSLANLTITQDNLYLLIPSKLSWMANMLSEDKGVGIVDAMKALYSSEIYSKLEDESTKAWNFGPVALYEEFQTERS